MSHLRDRFTLFAFSTVLSQGQYIHLYHVDSAAAFVLPPVRGSLLFKSLNLVFPRSEVKFSTARDASGSRVTLDAYLKKDPLSLCGQCPLDGPVPVGLLPSPPAKVSPDTGRHQHGWPQFRNRRNSAKLLFSGYSYTERVLWKINYWPI